jgi:hypothetical protein
VSGNGASFRCAKTRPIAGPIARAAPDAKRASRPVDRTGLVWTTSRRLRSVASDACSGSIGEVSRPHARTPSQRSRVVGDVLISEAESAAPARILNPGAGQRRCGPAGELAWRLCRCGSAGNFFPRADQTGLHAGAGANRPAKSALRVSNFGPDAPWARLKSGERILTKCLYFQALSAWARLGSNQRPLACEASALPLSYAPGRGREV